MPVAKKHYEQLQPQCVSPAMSMPHPAVLIFLWACVTVAMQSLQANTLLLAGVPLMISGYVLSAEHLLILLRRTRWIMLSLLLIYAYATPGVAMWASLAQFSPTYEGLIDGLLQLCRLAFALAGLAILLGILSQSQLIAGLYTLAYPLRYLGLSRERIAVRLALTLHYAESAMLDTASDWRTSIEQMLAPAEVKQDNIELHTAPFTLRDGLLLVLAFALMMLVWL
jgi:energy-coupling factor transport system permease protein